MSAITLRDGDAQATVAPLGAELRTWSVGGRDLLWTADPAWWPKVSPILFPIVGRVRDGEMRVDGRTYQMPSHGFAASRVFEIVEQSCDRVRLTLASDDATRAHYPFEFMLALSYRLRGEELAAAIEVENTGDGAMPYACGFHPAIRWPFAGGAPNDYAIVFEKEERADIPVITPGAMFSNMTRPAPLEGRRLRLPSDVFEQEALCFIDVNSSSLRFEAPDGAAVTMRTDDFPHYAFWSKPGAPYLCLEPWTGHGDPDNFRGELKDKPHMRLLAPGATARHAATFAFEAPR